MLTKPAVEEGDHSPRTRTRSPLTLIQKRQLVLDWFVSGSSIKDFRAGDKDIPRPFIRKAANALSLRELRKKREQRGVYEVVEAKVKAFHPNVCGPKGVDKQGAKLSLDRKREYVLEWFMSDSSIRDFRAGQENIPRPFIRKAAKALGLLELRETREQSGVKEIAVARIETFSPNVCKSVTEAKEASKLSKVVESKSGSATPKLTLDEKRQFVLEWFVSGSSIKDFRAGQKNVPRSFVRKAANALALRELSKEKEQGGVYEIAKARVDSFHPRSYRSSGEPMAAATMPAFSPEWMKKLVVEWFDDPGMRGVAGFLRGKHAFEARDAMMGIVEETSLRKLRKLREDPGVRDEAISAISGALERAGAQSVVIYADKLSHFDLKPAGVSHRESSGVGCATDIKSLILEWYSNEDMISIRRLLQEKNSLYVEATMTKLITENGLRRLRKNRNMTEMRAKAMEKIDSMFVTGASWQTGDAEGNGALC